MGEVKKSANRNAAIAELLTDGEKLKNFYRFAAQNPHIELYDACQIILARPDASVCFSFDDWNAMGRRIQSGGKGIPYCDREKNRLFVFDASDTYGENRYIRESYPIKRLFKGYSLEYIGQVIENIVFNEIRRRGYNAYVGKLGEREVDFIAENAGEKVYIQVAYSVASKETMSREVNSLLEIRDAYPKYVVSMDALSGGNKDGIRFIYLADFLLKKEW